MLTCAGWPNGKKLVSTCVQILVNASPCNASPCKSPQVNASGWPNEMQVQNLLQLASLFGQGLTFLVLVFKQLISEQCISVPMYTYKCFLTNKNLFVLAVLHYLVWPSVPQTLKGMFNRLFNSGLINGQPKLFVLLITPAYIFPCGVATGKQSAMCTYADCVIFCI